jgi:hypothetical protein
MTSWVDLLRTERSIYIACYAPDQYLRSGFCFFLSDRNCSLLESVGIHLRLCIPVIECEVVPSFSRYLLSQYGSCYWATEAEINHFLVEVLLSYRLLFV